MEFAILKDDVQKVRQRVTQTEQRISAVEDDLNPLLLQVRDVTENNKSQEAKLGDIEDRLRRNKLRFLGFPESAEGKNPEEFLLSWLKQSFGADSFSHLFAIERAYRIPLREPPPPGRYPRPMLAQFLYFRDKETILRKAHNLTELMFNNNRISIFLDVSAATQKRAVFQSVKQRLRECSLPYSMLYPAKLRVVHKGQTQFFMSSKEANRWLGITGSRLIILLSRQMAG